jgi:ATP adenylyltransferase
MGDFNDNLWAPWRMEYIRSLEQECAEANGCFLCAYHAAPADDSRNHVVWRGETAMAVMNRFPYTNGHMLVAPYRHIGDPQDLGEPEMAELGRMTYQAVALLKRCFKPDGFNVGANLGRCAGAGLPDHLHHHVVARWSGDTNYMAVLGGVRVIPDGLDATYAQLVDNAVAMGLRNR